MISSNTLRRLTEIMEQNDLVTYALSQYLNYHPRFLSSETVFEFAKECNLSIEDAFRTLFCAACGLDTADNRIHRQLDRLYFQTGLSLRHTDDYQNDPYYQTIRIPQVKKGRWELKQLSYAPFEPFVCGHPIVTTELREIPQIGYFAEEFTFPAVLEDGTEWMTVTPNEIKTMKEPIEKAHGRVLTLGLGLGYYAFMVSEKENVSSVTVVEKDADVIALFRELVLPQFPNGKKIRIIEADAFDYLQKSQAEAFDFVFADLWHDQSDGLECYIRLRKNEFRLPQAEFSYWIEPTLLSALRHMVLQRLTDTNAAVRLEGIDPYELLSDGYLRKLTLDLKKITD